MSVLISDKLRKILERRRSTKTLDIFRHRNPTLQRIAYFAEEPYDNVKRKYAGFTKAELEEERNRLYLECSIKDWEAEKHIGLWDLEAKSLKRLINEYADKLPAAYLNKIYLDMATTSGIIEERTHLHSTGDKNILSTLVKELTIKTNVIRERDLGTDDNETLTAMSPFLLTSSVKGQSLAFLLDGHGNELLRLFHENKKQFKERLERNKNLTLHERSSFNGIHYTTKLIFKREKKRLLLHRGTENSAPVYKMTMTRIDFYQIFDKLGIPIHKLSARRN